MDKPRQKTLVFCTAYTHAAAGAFYTWQQRYRTWVDAIRSTSLTYDQVLLIDDGSATLPDWPDLQILRGGDDLTTDAPLVLYHFAHHLGRRAISDFPGWVRSFLFAARFAEANQFEKIIHVEADGFLISRRIQQYVNDVQTGWVTFFCPLFQRPESGIQIIAGEAIRSYAKFAKQPVESLAGAVIETTLPFTHVETGFIGDRFGEYLDYVPRHADWCMQAVPNGSIPLDAFFWWLPRTPAGENTPVPQPSLLTDIGVDLGQHCGLWYTDFFWHFDKLRKPQTFFEIGTNAGHSLRCFSCDAVCVDPHFVLEADVIAARRRTYLYQGTSDEFFSSNDLSRIFPDGFEVAFLDGLHHAEVLLRDFISTERHSRAGSVIFMHDCLPLNERMAERERRWDETESEATRDFWTGDVWKVMVALKNYRPDLKVYYLDCGPAGLAVCMNPNRNSTMLSEQYDEIVAGFSQLNLQGFGFKDLWTLFPMLDSKKLIEDTASMKRVFVDGDLP
jgi:hypothetical protein